MEANRPTKLYVINTASGVRLDLDNPRPEAILIEDVAGGLSKVCRFGAQALEYYWVAQQSVLRHPIRSHTISLVYALVYRPLSLLLGDGGDEFAAEVGDVGDHAAPDQVRGDREASEYVSEGLLGHGPKYLLFPAGVLTGVARAG